MISEKEAMDMVKALARKKMENHLVEDWDIRCKEFAKKILIDASKMFEELTLGEGRVSSLAFDAISAALLSAVDSVFKTKKEMIAQGIVDEE